MAHTTHSSHETEHAGAAPHVVPWPIYVVVYVVLLVLLAATFGAATLDLGRWNVIVALIIAAIKTSLVVLIFMGVAFSSKLA